jgi:HlyD family type I secretion membrane fusion protein
MRLSGTLQLETIQKDNAGRSIACGPAAVSQGHPFPLRVMLAGMGVLIGFFSVFSLWLLVAPIEGAVRAPGVVGVATHRKTVQHLEGGIVEAILVREGDQVASGQPLVRLSRVQPAAQLTQLEGQYLETKAVVARLRAEREGDSEIEFPEELNSRSGEPAVQAIMHGQRNILESRRTLANDQRSVLEQKIAQAAEEIKGLEGQIRAGNTRKDLLREELAAVQILFDQQLTPRTRLLALKQGLAELEGNLSAYHAEIARIQQSVAEMRLQISKLRAADVAQVTEQLRGESAKVFELSQSIVKARDILRRTEINSPIDGVVMNIQVHTLSGVVSAGQPILDVVPIQEDLVVEAYVDPKDIDEVHAGMSADIKLTSMNRRERIPIAGVVSTVSADRLTDPRTGKAYYRALIGLSPDVAETEKALLVAGMGADVFIRTGARTPLEYLLAPITHYLQQGMRES